MSRDSQDEDRRLSWLQLAADWLALIRDASSADAESNVAKDGATGSADGQQPQPTNDVQQENAPAAAEPLSSR